MPAPTLVGPKTTNNITSHKPLIKGLTISGTQVHIYIDDQLYGSTKTLNHSSGTANFAYEPFLHLEEGEHKVYAIAEDEHGKKSRRSKELTFIIEKDHPAPKILSPKNNTTTPLKDLVIKGVAKQHSAINVYIDQQFKQTINLPSSETGTAGFTFHPDNLSPGNHTLYLTATSKTGKVSPQSEIITFTVLQPRIGDSAQTKAPDEKDKKNSTDTAPDIHPPSSSTKTATKTTSTHPLEEQVGGATQEDKTSEGEDKALGATILVILTILVLAWLLWVNKESLHFKQNKGDK